MIEWTPEAVAARSTDDIKTLRDNAAKRGNQQIVDLCEAELSRRRPARTKSAQHKPSPVNRSGQYVSELHFVCPSELGVTRNQDGTIWSGTWVVAESRADEAATYGSLVALHANKAEPSYLQGRIINWRKSQREARYSEDQLVQTEYGIDFQFESTSEPLVWKGDGSGEKGYEWSTISSTNEK